jgi:hypothetical protein
MPRKNNIQQKKNTNYNKVIPPNKPISSKSDILSNMGSTVAQGFSFGIGSSIAHNGINKLFNKDSDDDKTVNVIEENTNHCKNLLDLYIKCYNNNSTIDDDKCNDIFELYDNCNNNKPSNKSTN